MGKVVPPLHVSRRSSSAVAPEQSEVQRGEQQEGPDLRDTVASTPVAAARPRRALPFALLAATRPRQWIKNLLVFAAPGAAGLLGRPVVVEKTAAAAGLFLIASAGTYLVNDAIDAPADRVHPDKRHRPVASGELSAPLAIGVGSSLLVLAVVGAGFLAGLQLASVIGAYVVTSVTYTLWLKRVAIVELACVSTGFVLRAVAGGAAVHIPISPWFGIVTSSAALLVVAGKRSAEIDVLGRAGALHRQVLDKYSTSFLRSVRLIAAAVAIVSFCLWAFARAAQIDPGRADSDNVLFELSILPFVLGILSVELAIDSGEGGAPEELVLHSHVIQVLGAVCLALVAIGIYT
jgi:decaprenyl-phosphate phosphoribosyltransferase